MVGVIGKDGSWLFSSSCSYWEPNGLLIGLTSKQKTGLKIGNCDKYDLIYCYHLSNIWPKILKFNISQIVNYILLKDPNLKPEDWKIFTNFNKCKQIF